MIEGPASGLPAIPPLPPAPPSAERYPFWSFADVALFVGILVASALASMAMVALPLSLFHIKPNMVLEAVAIQSLLYGLTFAGLALLFRVEYQRPFWVSLGWTRLRWPVPAIMGCGLLTAFVVAAIGILLQTPTTSNRITEMLADPKAVTVVAIFGLTLGPLAEELGFRGFLQPLLVKSLGVFPGIIAAAVPFGLLHFQEYGNSWRHVVLISLAGGAFGWVRHRTGSTKASTLMHASYNALEFIAYFAQQGELRHT